MASCELATLRAMVTRLAGRPTTRGSLGVALSSSAFESSPFGARCWFPGQPCIEVEHGMGARVWR
eukprot:15253848-Alexandrium_andersonii.AAC.1